MTFRLTCRRGHDLSTGNYRMQRCGKGYLVRVCKECHRLRSAAYRRGECLPPAKLAKAILARVPFAANGPLLGEP